MEKETIFVDGMMWKDPSPKAPDWIKGNILINSAKLMEFLHNNQEYLSEKGWLSIDLKESKKTGGMYMTLNTYKPEKKEDVPREVDKIAGGGYPESMSAGNETINLDEIPF